MVCADPFLLYVSVFQRYRGPRVIVLVQKNGHIEEGQEPRLLSRQRHRELTKHLFPFNPVTLAAVVSASFRDRTDDTPHRGSLSRRALEPTTRIAITAFSYLVIDDWLSGLRSKDIRVKKQKQQEGAAGGDAPWVQHVWEIGLVCMTRHPLIGVSADGLMQLRRLMTTTCQCMLPWKSRRRYRLH